MNWSLLRPRRLAAKFALTITLVVAGVAFTIGAVIVAQDWWRFRVGLGERALLLAQSVADTAPEAVLRNDYWSLYRSLRRLTSRASDGSSDAPVLNAMILDADTVVLAHLKPSSHPLGLRLVPETAADRLLAQQAREALAPLVLSGGHGVDGFLEAVVPLYADQKLLGHVRVRLSTYGLFVKTFRSGLVVLGLTFGLVLLGSALGALASRRMVEPVTRGEFAEVAQVPVKDRDELGQLTATFNRMAEELAEKKALEQEIAVSEKLVALGRIAAGVAHEVNNPLAGMLNCLDTLKKHPGQPELVDRYVPLLDSGLNRIKDIVSSLLIELKIEESDDLAGPSCLEDVRTLIEAEIADRRIRLAWHNGLDPGIQLYGQRIQQVALNLLKNSLAFVSDGGNIEFRALQDGDCVLFEVQDDGPGIPVENRNQLFDPFFSTRPSGTGLGLWIAYRLVHSMRGTIDVDSEVGRGTTFLVVVPAEPVAAGDSKAPAEAKPELRKVAS